MPPASKQKPCNWQITSFSLAGHALPAAAKENCVHRQDGFQTIFEKMKAADGILLGSPVYSANISANMQAFLERAAVVCDMNPGLLKHKAGACFVTARRGGALNAVDAMNHFFLNHEMFVVGSTYWNMVLWSDAGRNVLNDEEGLATMDSLAENMIWFFKNITRVEDKRKNERKTI